jgi:hypothetical protein
MALLRSSRASIVDGPRGMVLLRCDSRFAGDGEELGERVVNAWCCGPAGDWREGITSIMDLRVTKNRDWKMELVMYSIAEQKIKGLGEMKMDVIFVA